MKYYAEQQDGFVSVIRPLTDGEYEAVKNNVSLVEVSADVAQAFATYRAGRCRLVGGGIEYHPDAGNVEIVRSQTLQRRAKLLQDSDWAALPDVPMTTEKRTEWAAYRQALRDVTLQADPFNIVWPVAPL